MQGEEEGESGGDSVGFAISWERCGKGRAQFGQGVDMSVGCWSGDPGKAGGGPSLELGERCDCFLQALKAASWKRSENGH